MLLCATLYGCVLQGPGAAWAAVPLCELQPMRHVSVLAMTAEPEQRARRREAALPVSRPRRAAAATAPAFIASHVSKERSPATQHAPQHEAALATKRSCPAAAAGLETVGGRVAGV